DLDTGAYLHANAGHPPPRWWRAALGTVEAVPDCAGPPLGIGVADTYSPARVRLEPRDVLVFYTDGLVEARSRLHGALGIPRLDTALREGAAKGAEAIKRKVIDSWQKFLACGETLRRRRNTCGSRKGALSYSQSVAAKNNLVTGPKAVVNKNPRRRYPSGRLPPG